MPISQYEIQFLLQAHQEALRAGHVADLQKTANEILELVVEDLEAHPEPDPGIGWWSPAPSTL